MKLTNDSYLISMGTKNFTEHYYREPGGWVKISARGRKFQMTAEQVLNHLLPAIAGVKPNLILKVEHREHSGTGVSPVRFDLHARRAKPTTRRAQDEKATSR